ncbi:MAG TPA: alpha/beta hydrolase, partial [Candidatus Limnocylindrales bacterium]|nr:alpha/beta hydrolase [Candidatus Limnocylindrales bacterium]
LGADDDPITPIAGARAIAGRLTDGYLIHTTGGAHVTYGRGDACVDGAIDAFLLQRRLPASRTIDCPGDVTDAYVPRSPTSAASFADALEAMTAVENEVFADPSYVLWDGRAEVRFGCRAGGFVAIIPETVRDAIRFADCQIAAGLPLTGTGDYTFDTGAVTWSVRVPGGSLEYESSPGRRHVSGTWQGEAVDLTR